MSKQESKQESVLNPHKITRGGTYVVKDGKAVKHDLKPQTQAKGSEAKSAKPKE